jgi:hypothetical protein
LIHLVSGREIKRKEFLKEPKNAIGIEISFTSLAPKTELVNFHIHNKDDETYVILIG